MSSKFLFQNARIKAIENKLLSPQQLQRLIDCGSVADAFKLLLELGFGQGISVTAGDFDALFTQEEKAMLEIIHSFNEDGALDAILVSGDMNNLKALYKSQCSGVAPALMPDGVYSVDALKVAIAGDATVLDGILSECVIALNKAYADEKLTPRMICRQSGQRKAEKMSSNSLKEKRIWQTYRHLSVQRDWDFPSNSLKKVLLAAV
ncbi:MAG: V-type ATPase subunit [Clostridia bacterium]|nr:V-type ATPase subunit [Clostridia bacterium]